MRERTAHCQRDLGRCRRRTSRVMGRRVVDAQRRVPGSTLADTAVTRTLIGGKQERSAMMIGEKAAEMNRCA